MDCLSDALSTSVVLFALIINAIFKFNMEDIEATVQEKMKCAPDGYKILPQVHLTARDDRRNNGRRRMEKA